ncbi:MAG: hypothetical protein ACRD16_01575 [Thermoanaerobaculia bacterium]
MAHLTSEQVARWRSNTLEPEEVLVVGDHLAECEACSALLSVGHPAEVVAAALNRELHEAGGRERRMDEQLVAWVEEASPARRWRKAAAIAIAASLLAGFGVLLRVSRPQQRATSKFARSSASMPLRDGLLLFSLDQKKVWGVPPIWRQRVEALMLHPDLDIPAAALEVSRQRETQRGEPVAPPPVRPVAPLSIVVVDDRPIFQWLGGAGARYRVQVFNSKFSLLAASPDLDARNWRPESGLPRSEVLSWSIVEMREGRERTYPQPPAAPAVFKIVSADSAREIEDARRTRSRLLLGLSLWHAGAISEATSEFQALRSENPGIPFIERLAATSVEGARGLRQGNIPN